MTGDLKMAKAYFKDADPVATRRSSSSIPERVFRHSSKIIERNKTGPRIKLDSIPDNLSIANEAVKDRTPKLSPLNDKHLDDFLQEDSFMSSHSSMSSSESDKFADKEEINSDNKSEKSSSKSDDSKRENYIRSVSIKKTEREEKAILEEK